MPIGPSLSDGGAARSCDAEPVTRAPAVVPMKVRRSIRLMPELALSGEDHRNVVLVCGGDHFIVANRAAWLNDRTDAGLGRLFDTITKREKCVRSKNSTFSV